MYYWVINQNGSRCTIATLDIEEAIEQKEELEFYSRDTFELVNDQKSFGYPKEMVVY